MTRTAKRWPSLHIAWVGVLVLSVVAGCRAQPPSRVPQAQTPMALVFAGSEKRDRGIKDETTLYVVRVRRGELTPEPVLTKQGLGIELVVPGGYVIVGGYTVPENGTSGRHQSFLYRLAEGTVRPVKVPPGEMSLDDAKAGRVLLLQTGRCPVKDLRVHLLDVPSMRLEKWGMPSGLEESRVGSRWCVPFTARMSPDLTRLALFVQPLARRNTALTSSLVVLDRDGTGARVLDSGLWPGWSPFVSWSRGPSLAWADNRRVVYVDLRGGFDGPRRHLLKMADATTGRVRALGRSPSSAVWRDSRTGEISFGAAGGKKHVLDVSRRGLEARLREEPWTERFIRSRTEERTTEMLRDTTKGVDVWRGRLGALGAQCASPDDSLLSFTVRPKKTENVDDLYLYDGRTGRRQKLFSGYLTGGLHWVGESPQGHD